MNSSSGEIIRLSLGPAANAVSSHLCNLEGLACTTATTSSSSTTSPTENVLCDPNITHTVSNEVYVPRILFVDGKNCFHSSCFTNPNDWKEEDPIRASWNGPIETYHFRPLIHLTTNNLMDTTTQPNEISSVPISSYIPSTVDAANRSFSSNEIRDDPFLTHLRNTLLEFDQVSASARYSRYHCTTKRSHQQGLTSQFISRQGDMNSRHIDWDTMGNESDADESDHDSDGDEPKRRESSGTRQRQQEEAILLSQRKMEDAWEQWIHSSSHGIMEKPLDLHKNADGTNSTNASSVSDTRTRTFDTPWINYFMPPHPPVQYYSIPLPIDALVDNDIHNATAYYSHHVGHYGSSFSSSTSPISHLWREDILGEHIRHAMESCDSIRGFQLMVDDDLSLFGGIACSLLEEELTQECKSSAKFVILVKDGTYFQTKSNANDYSKNHDNLVRSWRSEGEVIQSIRSNINSALTLSGMSQYSDLILPLSLNQCNRISDPLTQLIPRNDSLFFSSACVALALEAATLSYRLTGKHSNKTNMCEHPSMIGLLSRYFQACGQGDESYCCADKLTFHEFISLLRPSNHHRMVELSTFQNHPSDDGHSLHEHMLQGTSIERRRREASRTRDNYRSFEPGLWLEDSNTQGGMLTSLSPTLNQEWNKRSLHHHFALSSSLRNYYSNSSCASIQTDTTLLMESMGIRHRPESAVATVVNQSINQLATSGIASVAGSYWKAIIKRNGYSQAPVLSLLGNTTRVYPYLNDTVERISFALSRKNFGYVRRDVMSGVLPEYEDCKEAVEHCTELRDIYDPPSGSGIRNDGEGVYFDENED